MIAALQMYDWDEVRPRMDAFWARIAAGLRARGVDAPDALSRPAEISTTWPDRDLLLGQTCGLPYVSGCCGGAVLVARPDYGLPDANGGTYCSVLVCRAEDAGDLAGFRGRRAAINDMGSQSGCNALADAVQRAKLDDGRPFFGEVVLSGGHRHSARMVAERQADIAAIDAVSWALFAELEPVRHARLHVLGRTRTMPALPLITSRENAHHARALFDAVLEACAEAPCPGLPVSLIPAEDSDYDPIRKMAARLAGMRLAKNVIPIPSPLSQG